MILSKKINTAKDKGFQMSLILKVSGYSSAAWYG